MAKKLFLIPTSISNDNSLTTLPTFTSRNIEQLRIFFVEGEKVARIFLKKIQPQISFQDYTFYPLSEHTSLKEIEQYVRVILENDAGIISETGCPCVADPGADLVLLAHQNNIEVIPLVGPSSIILALMASGLNGQNFAFHGYLPREKEQRIKKIKELERLSERENQTQIFMEAPYRNEQILEDIMSSCFLKTLLCVACDLTAKNQFIKTSSIEEWKKQKPALHRKPTLFLINKFKDVHYRPSH